VEEFSRGEEGIDVVHVDEQVIQAFPNYIDQLTRELVAIRDAHKGKVLPQHTFEEWRESLIKEVSLHLAYLNYRMILAS